MEELVTNEWVTTAATVQEDMLGKIVIKVNTYRCSINFMQSMIRQN